MYSVKEVAQILGVSVHTIRYYDDCSLIPVIVRNNAKNRQFSDEALEWLFICITLRSTGLSIKDVKKYVDLYQQGDSTLEQRYNLMVNQKNKVLSEIEDLKFRLQLLDKKVDYYGELLNGEKIEWSHEFMQKMIFEGKNHNE